MQNLPPSGPGRRVSYWAKRKKFQLRHLPQYIIGFFLNQISRWLNLHPQAVHLMRRSLELGNPTNTIWPSETIPMNSRLFAGGFWNYGFFQFHRQYYFPFWAHLQYDPRDKSFIPRSHNILSMNQTQRNWVAISFPGKTREVSIDLAGAIMPEPDSYTVEFAILEKGKLVRPHDEPESLHMRSRSPDCVEISWRKRTIVITAEIDGVHVQGKGNGNLIVSLRPFNMEGPAFLDKLFFSDLTGKMTGDVHITCSKIPVVAHFSNLMYSDSLRVLPELVRTLDEKNGFRARKKKQKKISHEARCVAGLATGSLLYNSASEVDFFIHDKKSWKPPSGLIKDLRNKHERPRAEDLWRIWFPELPVADLPAPFGNWFKDSCNNLLTLWDFDSVTPGSFTYHHFWIRDAVIMMNSLMYLGGFAAVAEILKKFPGYVRRNGLFASQAGEWDANGQAMWILGRYAKMSGDTSMLLKNKRGIAKMITWIENAMQKNGGVLPPGFSAEHLGVADWYLWDNFWTLGGLRELQMFPEIAGRQTPELFLKLHNSLEEYLASYKYYPAALGRRKDAGMIGSIAAIYPMGLHEYFNDRMYETLHTIKDKYFLRGGFFQENIHSGINPYLTLQLAQAFLFSGDVENAYSIAHKLSAWARALHSFPEAVHPKTRGGCMGDGFHGWAFAELISLVKNMFVLELENTIVINAGIPEEWYENKFSMRNLHTACGKMDIVFNDGQIKISGLSGTIGKLVCLSLPESMSLVEANIETKKIPKSVNSPHLQMAKNRSFYEFKTISEKINLRIGPSGR